MNALISWLLPFLTLIADIGLVLFAIVYGLTFVNRSVKKFYTKHLAPLVEHFAMPLVFFTALGALLGSLFYSEVMHFAPCALCWYQRIFIYPQAFIAGLALWRSDKKINDYLITLSLVGAGIAIYHTALQANPSAFAPCSTSEFAVSCATKYMESYGFITFPVMSLTAFAIIILSMWLTREKT
jgi:disulfide bond formation protein DsbB